MVRPLLVLLAACSGTGPGGDDGTSPDTPAPTTDGSTIRDPRFDGVALILDLELDDQLASGVSIAVLEQGVLTWAEGFGSADPENDVPVTPETRFQIGSTTKQMTAALVLQQEKGGALELEQQLSAVLPDVWLEDDPTWAETATLELLLSHQGGINDYIDWTGSADDDHLAEWHEGFFKNTLYSNNPPGAFWNYSNPNFTVAGLAAEAHDPLDRYYPDMMVEDLFVPLGMNATVARKADVDEPYARSTGVDLFDGSIRSFTMDDLFDPASMRPAGLVWSTPTDMTTWGSALLQGNQEVFGSDDLPELITEPRVSTLWLDDHIQYGLGMFVYDIFPMSDGTYVPLLVWEHAGITLSMTSSFMVLPEHDVAISILSNGWQDAFWETTQALMRVVVDPWPEPSDYVPTVDPEVTALHVGTYDDPNNVGPIEITAGEHGELQIAMPLLDDFGFDVDPDLIPITSDFFFVEIDGDLFDLAFVRDPAGGPSLWVRDQFFVGERVPPDLLARPGPPVGRDPPMLGPVPLPTRLLPLSAGGRAP